MRSRLREKREEKKGKPPIEKSLLKKAEAKGNERLAQRSHSSQLSGSLRSNEKKPLVQR